MSGKGRICVLSALLIIFFSNVNTLEASTKQNQAGDKDEALWSMYLTSPENWPATAEHATQDITSLPYASTDQVLNAKEALGQALFSFPKLSSDQQASCASCHFPDVGFSDPSRVSVGAHGKQGTRNSPSLLNVALWDVLFWDGRETDLATQATEPLIHPLEMNSSPEFAEKAIKREPEMLKLWKAAYPNEKVTWTLAANALAAFQNTLKGPHTGFDKFVEAVKHNDHQSAREALSTQELRGLHIYRTTAGCVNCHNGALFSDQAFHNTGLHYFGRKFEDLGVYEITHNVEDMGKFRTPMLRHLMTTRPWMHNGLFDDLRGIVRMYAHGGARPKRPKSLPSTEPYPQTSEILTPFRLSKEEEDALIAFLMKL